MARQPNEERAKLDIRTLADREQGLLHLLFDVEYNPVMLPDNTPPEIVSAWTRLHNGAIKDLAIIQRWLDAD